MKYDQNILRIMLLTLAFVIGSPGLAAREKTIASGTETAVFMPVVRDYTVDLRNYRLRSDRPDRDQQAVIQIERRQIRKDVLK